MSKHKLPRIVYLKMFYGDDYMDYIKDDYGIDKFLEKLFENDAKKPNFLRDSVEVKDFAANWITFTNYYKEKFGKRIRDKEAITLLSGMHGFKKTAAIYDFRCKLFKGDFSLNPTFEAQLKKNLRDLKKINKQISTAEQTRNQRLIKNKMW